jgi:nitrogen fixation NifU-like protein
MYSQKLLEHFRNPKHAGEMKNPDGVGQMGNPICGDVMKVFIKVKDNRVIDASFHTYGCAAAIGASDVLCELIIGKTIEEAFKINNKDIADHLGGLPVEKIHCSVLGMQTLRKAIEDYKKNKVKNKKAIS